MSVDPTWRARTFRVERRPIPVLLYHSIPMSEAGGDRLSVPYGQFSRHLDAILSSGRTAITIEELAGGLRGEFRLPDRPVAITFDDAYRDTLNAVELTIERGLRATIFVTTGPIGSGPMISHAQLQSLAELRTTIELGAHSVTHPFLDELALGQLVAEVRDSRCQLEELVGRPIGSFAYPYGAHDRRVREVVIAAGFRSAAAVKDALSHTNDDPWAIARWTVRAETSADRIAEVLEGLDVPMAWRRERLRTRGFRIVRRGRRRLRQVGGGCDEGPDAATT